MGDRALACAAMLVLAACSNDPTRIVVVADTDLAVPSSVDAMRFVIDARAIGGDLATREASVVDLPLPLVLPVVHAGGPLGPVVIEVQARKGDTVVVSRAARLAFVPSRSIALHLTLASSCASRRGPCGGDETCADGACIPLDVDGASLPAWRGRQALAPVQMGVADASVPVAPDDAAPPHDAFVPADAGAPCARGCACEQRCESSSCSCGAGCACTFSCASGEECDDVRCDGGDCTVDARGAAHVKVRCERGARCTIDARGAATVAPIECRGDAACEADCGGASRCEMRCDPGASCLLRCDGAWGTDCALQCSGTQTRCGDDLVACNRACP